MGVVVCVEAFGTLRPGDEAEVPDGAEVSGGYFAEPGSPAALRAQAEAKARAEAEAEMKARAEAEASGGNGGV